MIDRLFQIHLEPIAQDHRRGQKLRTLTKGWLVAAGVGVLLILLHRFTALASGWLFLGLVFVTVGWSIFIHRRSVRAPLDFKAVAREIEAANPKLHTLLLTAVEQLPPDGQQELNYLQTRVIREALAEDRRSEWRQRAARQLKWLQVVNGAALIFLIGVLLTLQQATPPRVVFLAVTDQGVTVTPGDTSVEKGTSLVVLARFAGDVPAEPTLVLRPANEPEQRIPLTKNLDDPVFGASVPEVKGELTYQVEYAGENTRTFRVEVFEYPRLERADATIKYPAYTGQEEKTIQDTRRVSAVEGSALVYTFHLNKPVKTATLIAKEGPTLPLVLETNRPNVYTSAFTLERSGRYELLLVDEGGRTNRLPPLFLIEALTNRVPDLKFVFPRGDQRVSALEEIAFKGETSDDFGLKAYGFAYNLAGQETKAVELGQTAAAHEKRTFEQLVPLESLGAQPDQLLSYYLWAEDIGPDGNVRRTTSDMFFAEVRPFDEIFREGQPQDRNQQQSQGQGQQNEAEKLAELQKQIITATWNVQRRETVTKPSVKFKPDVETVKESQEKALEQVRAQMEMAEDPRVRGFLETVQRAMEQAIKHLETASDGNAPASLPPALAAEQSAYQALLRLAARETQVAQSGQQSGSGSSRGGRTQRQINELELKQSENRYETERQAAAPQNPEQREQLQAFNRLKELAQRQQDVNERLKELQSALQEAKTEKERQELRERLKRLQEEQQQMLADVDELRQRMDRPENQAPMNEARQQLDQTRENVQRASEAMERGEVAQALSSGTRAQRDLQQMRDDFRKQSSSQFAEDMRQLRNEARDLAQQQEEIGGKLDALQNAEQRRSLTDSEERKELAAELDQQKQRMEQLTKHATDVTEKAEPVEPLLSRQLYETLRKATQDDARNMRETSDDLLTRGRLRQGVEQRLREGRSQGKQAVEVVADLLRDGFSSEADSLEQRARRSLNDFKTGMERAAESVLGDDTEALRLARNELDELTRQLERELSQGQGRTDTNANRAGTGASVDPSATPGERGQQAGNQAGSGQAAGEQLATQPAGNTPGQGEGQATGQPGQQAGNRESQQPGQGGQRPAQGGQGGRQPGQSGQAQGGEPGQGGQPAQQASGGNQTSEGQASPNGQSPGGQGGSQQVNRGQGGQRGGASFLNQFGGNEGGGGGTAGGPLTGTEYGEWSDRLRNVEEMLDVPELRAEAARIRDRVRTERAELKRHSKEPQWDLVKMNIAGPLAELRTRVAEELARRESKDALVPLDRDPVPTRYSELVRRYYEELGKSDPNAPAPAGGTPQ